jgi:hypothetical protein
MSFSMECDQRVEKALAGFEGKVRVPTPDLSQLRSAQKRQQAVQRHRLEEMTGVDLTELPGLDLPAVGADPLRDGFGYESLA